MFMKLFESSRRGTSTIISATALNTLAARAQRETISRTLKRLVGISHGRLKVSKYRRWQMIKTIRLARRNRFSYGQIAKLTGINRWTIREWATARQSVSCRYKSTIRVGQH